MTHKGHESSKFKVGHHT